MVGSTATGLDRIIDIILADEGLAARASSFDIAQGAEAADQMNGIILEGLRALGLASDGVLTAGDMRDLSDWIATERGAQFTAAHGDDEGDTETGFHLVQGDGGVIRIYGDKAINTVADGLYHLVFGYDRDRLINEDGNKNARLESAAWWLNELLADELQQAAQGTGPIASAVGDTTPFERLNGLDQLLEIALNDPGLGRKISTSDLHEGIAAGAELNAMITNIIRDQGLANDGSLTPSDILHINEVIRSDPGLYARFVALHGNDENNVETGFHLIQGDGAETGLYTRNAIDTVADGIYHIGFDIRDGKFVNEDGNKNASVGSVAAWMELLLHDDLATGSLVNTQVEPTPDGTTGTGLDDLIEVIKTDVGLEQRISLSDIRGGIAAADTINHLIVEGIETLGLANDGRISTADVREINTWIQSDTDRYASFVDAHGNDEGNIETGFHLVQGDGAEARLFGQNAVNTVGDGIYHIGFDIIQGRFRNEDGDANQTAARVAAWINSLLNEDDLAGLANANVATTVEGSTGTGLDRLIEIIGNDPSLEERISTSEIVAGARAADALNGMIIEGLRAVGAAADGQITETDVVRLNSWIREDADRLARFTELHGNDEDGIETGFHLVQGDGDRTDIFGRDAVDTVADGIYHAGFEIADGRFRNEDGDKNASVKTVADWLDQLLYDDLDGPALINPALDPDSVDVAALDAASLMLSVPSVQADGNTGYQVLQHDPILNVAAATLTMTFSVNDLTQGMKTLLSKDAKGYEDGGHLTVWVNGTHLQSRIQTADGSEKINKWNVLEAGRDYALAYTFDGTQAQLYLDGTLLGSVATSADWTQNDEEIAIGANIWARDDRRPEWVDDVFDGSIQNVKLYDRVLNEAELIAVGGVNTDRSSGSGPNPTAIWASGSTGTGLDRLVDVILGDVGLQSRISAEEINAGAMAADSMNASIVAAVQATGVANDGVITAGDMRLVSDWIQENRRESFVEQHGNDENGVETGFHLVQGDGGAARLYGEAAVNTVADGLYHLVFGYERDNIINEDGNRNARLEDLAYWLTELTSKELAQAAAGGGPFFNPAGGPYVPSYTGTGLDLVHQIIGADSGLARNVNTADLQIASKSAHAINMLILDAIAQGGLANDGDLTASDVRDIAKYIRSDAGRLDLFTKAHGNDEGDVETGYHLVQNDGAVTELFGRNAINTIFDGLYHIGFEISGGRFKNEDGNKNASVSDVAFWLSTLLKEDIASGALASDVVTPVGTTGTGLDRLVDIVLDDPGLAHNISESEIRAGAEAADVMANLIVQGIIETGVAKNGTIKASDIYDVSAWIRADDARFDAFKAAHGDDEEGIETGFHLVQGDGAKTRTFDDNAVNTVADGLFHMGFEIIRGRLTNEDGNKNASTHTAAGWLDTLFSDADFARLSEGSGENPYVMGTTGTGLDQLVNIITEDDGLANQISTADMRDGALAADALNAMIVGAIVDLGLANDSVISAFDVRDINGFIQNSPDLYAQFVALHGNDEGEVETGYHLVQGDGAATALFGKNAVNTVGDGLYHIGFDIERDRFVNEDGNKNASVSTVAEWLSELLADDLADGSLRNEALSSGAVDPDDLAASRVFSLDASFGVTKEGGQKEFATDPAWNTAEATVLFGFTADSPEGREKDTIFSRDGSGYQDGGHVTAYVKDDDLIVRFQNTERSTYLKATDAIEAGVSYDGAFTFDGTTAALYLGGQLIDLEAFDATWVNADEAIMIGGSLMQRRDGQTRSDDLFEGEIDMFAVHDKALNQAEIIAAFQDGMFNA